MSLFYHKSRWLTHIEQALKILIPSLAHYIFSIITFLFTTFHVHLLHLLYLRIETFSTMINNLLWSSICHFFYFLLTFNVFFIRCSIVEGKFEPNLKIRGGDKTWTTKLVEDMEFNFCGRNTMQGTGMQKLGGCTRSENQIQEPGYQSIKIN